MPIIEPSNYRQPFRSIYFPDASDDEWNSWKWQLANRLLSLEDLEKVLELTEEERDFFPQYQGQRLPFALTPYYLSLIDPNDPNDPIRHCMIPKSREYHVERGDLDDPLGEEELSPVPGLVHKYPDRVLLLTEHQCPSYCRYCTRGRLVGRPTVNFRSGLDAAIAYIQDHPEVHDVLISGGDPLLASEQQLDKLLGRLAAIPHLDYVRIGTKIPMNMPQRITPELCNMLSKHHPIFISVHATHPNELTAESALAFNRLADAGVAIGSQTVFLKGINDDADTLKDLFRALIRVRVRPYYLLLCDPITGSSHFRASVEHGLDVMAELQGRLSGYAIPKLILDIPNGGGKIPLVPDYINGSDDEKYFLTNFAGKAGFTYPKG